ncbi:disulfide oxidoreductase [Paenibacillus terreus]|uniref:Disulfide oxidoreductase n=1 Tax=Paenibacillus terreus TaxID=1387834 RepID=A0ABV5BA13_9BACL
MFGKKSDLMLFFAWIVACVATLGSLFLSEYLGYEPCKLCWFQRILMYPLTVLLGIAYFRGDSGIRVYILPLSVIGGLISAYHVTIQRIAAARAAAAPSTSCGRVSCETDYLNWFGFITIPMLALVAFILIIAAMIVISRQERRRW